MAVKKADLLKKNVRKTSRGLFDGIEKLDAAKEKAEKNETIKEENNNNQDAKVNDVSETEQISAETVQTVENTGKTEPVAVDSAVDAQTPVHKKETASETMVKEQQAVPETVINEEQPKVLEPVLPVESMNTSEPIEEQAHKEEYVPVNNYQAEISNQTIFDNSAAAVNQNYPGPQVNMINEQGVNYNGQRNYQQMPMSQIQNQSMNTQQMPNAQISNAQTSNAQMQNVQATSGQMPVTQVPYYQVSNNMGMYPNQLQQGNMQPVAPMQPNMQQNMQQGYYEPKAEKKATGSKQEKGSRYEKDKFLLLDIRGLRDYVEHMAKASNLSATKYIRKLIEEDMHRNMDIYLRHKELEEQLKQRR